MAINLFELMKIFVQLAECGSFTKTEERLKLHRPAVTKGIQQLEDHLNTRLLQRTTRQIHLTPEGEAFYQRCKLLLGEVDDVLQNFSPNRSLAGLLRVDMPTLVAKSLIIVPPLTIPKIRHFPLVRKREMLVLLLPHKN